MTVLFADVVGSASIAASVDVERLREIMTEVVERSADVVHRYGGTVEYNGDGVMALFGAPVALEDHALRACLAAIALQEEANRLAAVVLHRDNVPLQLRVGLNSGRVIAGEIGSGSLGYRATGEAVLLAQRMEAAAPPGGVMLSEATARSVEHLTVLSDAEWVTIKNAAEPVLARRLLSIGSRDRPAGRTEAGLVGRRWEMAALEAIVDRGMASRGGVVNLVGPPGIGKSRVAREVAAMAGERGASVFWSFCESHTRDIPFYALTRLLKAANGVTELTDGGAARAWLREQIPDADAQDLALLAELLGVADPDVVLPQIDPDARRRRLTALINAATLTRTEPALFVIDDAQWIDAVSESMLAGLLTVIARTPSVVLITSRPEYGGALSRVSGAQTIALAPLGDSDTAELLAELLGSDRSVRQLTVIVAERAAGNPFFAEEIVRELVQRGVLVGEYGSYVSRVDVAELSVPATVEVAIEARIDRLSTPAKRTLYAASVIGAHFEPELLTALELHPVFDELLDVELIDQVRFTPSPEYAFHHPLIRAVAYESQLKSDRSERHRRVAAAIQARDPGLLEENASLIAEHLYAAGDLPAAYGWQMRAATWAAGRALGSARASWERARRIADQLPEDPGRLPMRIAPRTMLCATDWYAPAGREAQGRFAELRELCAAAGDRVSLAIGMTGPSSELLYAGHTRESARLASEQMALLESIGNPTLTVGLSFAALVNWCCAGEFDDIVRWSQIVIDLSAGDPSKGGAFGLGSPLAAATAFRGVARWWLGTPGWRHDLDDAIVMARSSDPATLAAIVSWTYGLAIQYGVLRPDDAATRASEEAVRIAAGFSKDVALSLAEYTLGVALLNRHAEADRHRGLELMVQIRDMWLGERVLFLVPVTQFWIARETARRGDRDGAIPVMRKALDDIRRSGGLTYDVWGTGVLVETLLERGAEGDVTEAEAALERCAHPSADEGSAMLEITRLRLRALLARARGDDVAFQGSVIRYRDMAKSLGFEGHIVWAEAMIKGGE